MADIHTDETLSGIDPETELSVSEEKRESGLSYVSKSRIETFIQCPFKFYNKYWCEHRPPSTKATERGSSIHEVFEEFHAALIEHVNEHNDRPERFSQLLPETSNLTQWAEYIGSFFAFEERRWEEAERTVEFAQSRLPEDSLDKAAARMETWVPREVEAEFWMGEPPDDYEGDPDYVDDSGPPVGDAPWMGKADVVLETSSIPHATGSGVTIIDYKTGSCPKVKYEGAPFLDEIMNGKFRETEYYSWLAQEFYDVDAVGIYYPKNDQLVMGEHGVEERRFEIKNAALSMQNPPEELDRFGVPENYQHEPQNLCHWGSGQCWFYNQCPSTEGK